MGLRIYKSSNFDQLVSELDANLGREELVSVKLDCHRLPDNRVAFWYAVVITKPISIEPPYEVVEGVPNDFD